jgi:hypothetical protein
VNLLFGFSETKLNTKLVSSNKERQTDNPTATTTTSRLQGWAAPAAEEGK